MSGFDEIVAGITIDTYEDGEAEQAFVERLRDVLDDEADVKVAGRAMVLEAIEAAPRRQRVRAVVSDGSGRWRVSLDALSFEPDTSAAVVVDAYRHWLGYEVERSDDRNETTSQAVSDEKLQTRIAELQADVDEALTTLEGLDLGELETWLGDDDPLGRNEQYWPDSMYVFREQTDRLDDLAGDIGRLVDAGVYGESRRLVEMMLYGLEGLVYDYFCPNEVRLAAAKAVDVWLRCLNGLGESRFDPGRIARHLVRWLEYFELFLRKDLVVSGLPEVVKTPFIEELETFIDCDDGDYRRASTERGSLRLLTELRRERGELELLWKRFSLEALDGDTVDALAEWWGEKGDWNQAIEVVEVWLRWAESSSSYVNTRRVHKRRRQLLAQSGRSGEVLDELWKSFEDHPTTDKLEEILELTPEARHDELRQRAVAAVSDDARMLINIAAKWEPFDSLARCIEETDIDRLTDVSSWKLQDAAPNLESEWPEAAVKVYTALGWRHVDRGKSKYYHLSLEAFEEARDLYRELDREDDWRQVVEDVTAEHGRKYSFMPGFREISG